MSDTPTPAQADEKALWARYVPEWGCMKLCAKSDFGAVEYRLAALRPEGEAVAWIYEDELPASYPYDAMWPHSEVRSGVRMFPVYGPAFVSPPAPAGVKVKVKTSPAAQGTVAVLNAADRMREFMEGADRGMARVPVAHIAEWRKLLSERYRAEVERVNRATDAEIGGIHRLVAPSPEALPAGVEAVRVAQDCAQWLELLLAETGWKEPGGEQYIAASIARAKALASAPAPEDRT